MWNDAFRSVLAEHNEAVLSVAELDAPLVVEDQAAHQSQQRGDGLFVKSCGLWLFLGLGLVSFGLVLVFVSFVMFPGAQEIWAQGC